MCNLVSKYPLARFSLRTEEAAATLGWQKKSRYSSDYTNINGGGGGTNANGGSKTAPNAENSFTALLVQPEVEYRAVAIDQWQDAEDACKAVGMVFADILYVRMTSANGLKPEYTAGGPPLSFTRPGGQNTPYPSPLGNMYTLLFSH